MKRRLPDQLPALSSTVYAESAHCLLMVGHLVYPIDRTLPMVLSYSRGRSDGSIAKRGRSRHDSP